MRLGVAGMLLAALAYIAFRLFVHSSALLEPAVIVPQMDIHRALSPALDARIDRLFHERFDSNRSDRPKLVALTFDDGPYPVTTPLLLATLKDLNIHATFFLIGRDAIQFPDLARRIAADGNEIANHTLTHPNLDQLSAEQVRSELDEGRSALQRFASDPAIGKYMRPPHGRYTEATVREAIGDGYSVILWNDDPGDFREVVTPASLIEHLRRHASAPDIILLHSGRLATVEAMPEVARVFRAAGYRFVTAGELLRAVPWEKINHPAKGSI